MPLSTQVSAHLEDQASAKLSLAIEKLKATGDTDYKLLTEHLETACAYFLGAMPLEAALKLKLAQQCLPGKPLPGELDETIATILEGLSARHKTVPDAREVSAFFQRAGVSFGIFYPTKHVVAVFSSLEAAQAGHQALASAMFRMWETIVITGDEAEQFLEELRAHEPLSTGLMTEISKLPPAEASVVDRYAALAHTGASFLVAYASDEAEAEKVCQILEPLHPDAMHWFMPGYIRHLI
jgi:hypothetical protein